jgi:flagellar biosynthesis protein FliR
MAAHLGASGVGAGDIGALTRAAVFGSFLLFCRIGGCLMVAPGVSNTQIPVQIRLFVAIAVTLALAPALIGDLKVDFDTLAPPALARLIVMEALIGVMIGLLGRAFFSALETLATASAQFLGLANPFGVAMDHDQSTPPLSSIVTIAAMAILFAGDFHWEILRGLVASYRAIPLMTDFDTGFTVRRLAEVLGESFVVAARVASPFFIYSLLANFALALINRVTPQIAVFFVAPPFLVGGGLLLMYLVSRGEVGEFMATFSYWLSRG